jgi:hypothetical protein
MAERLQRAARGIPGLEAELGQACDRERAGTNAPDGWPRRASGAEGSGGSGDEYRSSTERAALTPLDPDVRPSRDMHRTLTLHAYDKLQRAVQELEGCRNALGDLARLRAPDGGQSYARKCEACAGRRGRGGDRDVAHRGTVGDRLAHVVDLCEACYQFVVLTAKSGSRGGRLPDAEQVRRHEDRGRWRVKTGYDEASVAPRRRA